MAACKQNLNASMTEDIFFRNESTTIPDSTKYIKMNWARLDPNSGIKYLGLSFDEHLTWIPEIQQLNSNLNRANNLLSNARHQMPFPYLTHL